MTTLSPDWTITALNSTTYTAIKLPTGKNCGSVTFYSSDGSDLKIAKDSSGTDERPFPPEMTGESWTFIKEIDTTGTIFYAKAVTGTPDLILLYQAKPRD